MQGRRWGNFRRVIVGFNATTAAGQNYRRRAAFNAVGLAVLAWTTSSHAQQTAETNDRTRSNEVGSVEVLARSSGADTDNSGSYAGRAITLGKTPTVLREVPQSVSVITRARIEDQNFTDVGDALRYTTGVQSTSVGGDYNSFGAQARGATADYQVNGLNQLVDDRAALFDMAMFDRIEVLRGPAGLFKGAGSAGATINLVRKSATATPHFRGALTGGSWGTVRGEADVNGGLNASGSLRARIVAVGEERGTNLRNTDNSKAFGFATLAVDFDPGTTLAIGGAVQQAKTDYFFGLPAFANGTLLDVPRSTSFATDWARGDLGASSVFGELEHRLGNGGFVKAVLQRSTTSRETKSLFSGGGLQTSGRTNVSWNLEDIPTRNLTGDVYLTTPFTLWDQTHNFLIGGDYADTQQTTYRGGGTAALTPVNIFDFDPGPYPEPTFNTLFANLRAKTKSYGVYSQLRVKPVADLTLVGGARFSWRKLKDLNQINGARGAGPNVSGRFTPYLAAIYNVAPNLSVYGSQTEIFQPQTATTVAGSILPPVEGRQYETGVKGDFFNARLNASAAVFQTTRSNEALPDPVNPGFSVAGGKRRVRGIEAEVSGQVTPAWSISAGYAYNETKILVAPPTPFLSAFPSKHVFSLWTNYAFNNGLFDGFELGGGVRTLSAFQNLVGGVRFAADGYTVASTRVSYRISDTLNASVNVENLFDKTYYTKVGNATANNYYGAPRTVMITLRANY
jgi:outer membrane receptor for ferric coprogen and ferric-rhodotorulic acid